MSAKIQRTIHPVVKILDEAKGVSQYIASDETVDRYREVIRASGWRFTNFQKNAPFVDSHQYDSIDKLLGKVVDFQVRDGQLVETVQWAIDVPGNKMAKVGFDMTKAGYLKAVSVGFTPVRFVSKYDQDQSEFKTHLRQIGAKDGEDIRTIWIEQEQIELSACIIGANPNALAKAYKDGILDDSILETISSHRATSETGSNVSDPAEALLTQRRAQMEFLERLTAIIKKV